MYKCSPVTVPAKPRRATSTAIQMPNAGTFRLYKDQIINIPNTDTIRALNDAFRRRLTGGTLMLTAGIVALGTEAQARIIAAVQAFDAFTSDNDPYGEHDFGSLNTEGERIFFKLDNFDLTRAMHSEDAADPSKTERVLTIMLASEY